MNTYWQARQDEDRAADIARVSENLAYIAANPTAHYPAEWISSTQAEARALGLLPQLAPRIGCNCRPDIDRGIVYGGDREDAL